MYDDLFVSTNGDTTTFFLLFYCDYVIDSVGFVLNYSFKYWSCVQSVFVTRLRIRDVQADEASLFDKVVSWQ